MIKTRRLIKNKKRKTCKKYKRQSGGVGNEQKSVEEVGKEFILAFTNQDKDDDDILELIESIKKEYDPNDQQKIFNSVNENGNTALILACVNKMEDVALKLIETGYSNPEHIISKNGNTALILACDKMEEVVALELIKREHYSSDKTYSKIIGQSSGRGNTALILACFKNKKKVAEALIKTGHSKPEQKTDNGFTALMCACMNNMKEVALELIKREHYPSDEKYSEIIGQQNNKGNTALFDACLTKMFVVAEALIKTGYSNPEAVNNKFDTALSIICKNNDNDGKRKHIQEMILKEINKGKPLKDQIKDCKNINVPIQLFNDFCDVYFYKNKAYKGTIQFPTKWIIEEKTLAELKIIYNENNVVCQKVNADYANDKLDFGLFVLKLKRQIHDTSKESLNEEMMKVIQLLSKNTGTIGMMVMTIDPESHLKIELLCSFKNDKFKYIGSIIMEHAIDFAYLNSMKKINLISVDTAVEFYKKMGFHIIYEETQYDEETQKQEYKQNGIYPMSKTLNSGNEHKYVVEEEEEDDDDKIKKNVGGRRRNTQNKKRKPLLHHQTPKK